MGVVAGEDLRGGNDEVDGSAAFDVVGAALVEVEPFAHVVDEDTPVPLGAMQEPKPPPSVWVMVTTLPHWSAVAKWVVMGACAGGWRISIHRAMMLRLRIDSSVQAESLKTCRLRCPT